MARASRRGSGAAPLSQDFIPERRRVEEEKEANNTKRRRTAGATPAPPSQLGAGFRTTAARKFFLRV